MPYTPPKIESDLEQEKSSGNFKIALLIGLVLTVGILAFFFHDRLSLENLAKYETYLREYQTNHPLLVYVLAFLLYVSITGMSLPGAAILSLAFAWYFGFWPALVLISFASTAGATVAFLLSRYLLRDWIRNRFGDRLKSFDESLEREGAFYLFTLRLIPAVPFFVINALMGLTNIRATTFWWVSQIGMLPGTIVFVYTGSRFPTLAELSEHGVGGILTWDLWLGFALIGVFPLVVKKLFGMRKHNKALDN